MNIIVCGVNEVAEYIDEVKAVISIADPGYSIYAPEVIVAMEEKNPYSVKRFEFHDIWPEVAEPGEEMVTEEIIEAAIEFARDVYNKYGAGATLLVHCHQGISRSAAIAIAIYSDIIKDPQQAIDLVMAHRPQARPNIHVITLADELLGYNGKMLQAVYDALWHIFENDPDVVLHYSGTSGS